MTEIGPPQDFLGGIVVKPLRARIPTGECSIEITAGYCVVRLLHDCSEMPP